MNPDFTEKQKEELVAAARVGAKVPDYENLWHGIEERVNVRDSAASELVTPRKLKHS